MVQVPLIVSRLTRIRRGLRSALLLAAGTLALSACGTGRDAQTSEQAARAQQAADRAERAQKASETALAEISAQSGKAVVTQPANEPEASMTEDDAESDDGTTPDVDPDPFEETDDSSSYVQG